MHHYFEIPEVTKLLRVMHARKSPKSQMQHLAALTLFVTGTRIGQLRRIKGKDIFQRNGVWAVMVPAAKKGNTVVCDLRIDSDPAFDMSPLISLAQLMPNACIFGSLSRQYLNAMLKVSAPEVGIHPSFAHTHTFRHTIARIIYKKEYNLGDISEYLGHKDPKTALYYARANDGERAQATVNAMVLA